MAGSACGPVGAGGPGGPTSPRSPLSPMGPANPGSPLSPLAPTGPAGPSEPAAPRSPFSPGPHAAKAISPARTKLFAKKRIPTSQVFLSALTGRRPGDGSALAPAELSSICGLSSPHGSANGRDWSRATRVGARDAGPRLSSARRQPSASDKILGSGGVSPASVHSNEGVLAIASKFDPQGACVRSAEFGRAHFAAPQAVVG